VSVADLWEPSDSGSESQVCALVCFVSTVVTTQFNQLTASSSGHSTFQLGQQAQVHDVVHGLLFIS